MNVKPRITVQLNGEAISVLENSTLQELIVAMGLTNKRIAIECNGAIIPRSEYSSLLITADHHLEIVQAIGGG